MNWLLCAVSTSLEYNSVATAPGVSPLHLMFTDSGVRDVPPITGLKLLPSRPVGEAEELELRTALEVR
jgi:hypothetical protein